MGSSGRDGVHPKAAVKTFGLRITSLYLEVDVIGAAMSVRGEDLHQQCRPYAASAPASGDRKVLYEGARSALGHPHHIPIVGRSQEDERGVELGVVADAGPPGLEWRDGTSSARVGVA